MAKTEELEAAFAEADAILRLEGFERTEAMTKIQREILAGRMTLDEAIESVIKGVLAAR